MKAKDIFKDIDKAFIYMERYVNDGSPSGWTKKKTTSADTNPLTGKVSFPLVEFNDSQMHSVIIGEDNPIFTGVNYCHPDSREYNSEVLQNNSIELNDSKIIVAPMSGGRTLFVVSDEYTGFIKLTYDVGRLGRVDRQMKYEHCMSSFEVSDTIKKYIDESMFDKTYSILLERSGKVTNIPYGDTIYEWGTMLREYRPYPYVDYKYQLVPGFSLFAKDYYSKETLNDECLINQFIALSGIPAKKYLLNVIKISVDAWFQTLLNCAFILELHGQNCYYEVDENYTVRRIVIKDMDSVDKDITLATTLGLRTEWKSFPYACFYKDTPEDHPWYYNVRPSYMYDFKLGTYILKPLMDAVCSKYNLNPREIQNEIKLYVQKKYMPQIPKGYFPEDGSWYDCDDSERKPGTRREYFAHKNPLFR